MPKAAPYRVIWDSKRRSYELHDTRRRHALPVVPGSHEWFAWLASVPSFTFIGQYGQLTVRQEVRPPGGTYWYAYRRIREKMAKRYLGHTGELTLAHLEEVAHEIAAPPGSLPEWKPLARSPSQEPEHARQETREPIPLENGVSRTDRVGQQLGNYRLLRLLGRGGSASVYLGEHIYLKSQAALKILHTYLSDQDAPQFVMEAQTLARLSHPHIVRVLDFALQDGTPFLVMEYAPHGNLRQRHPSGTRLPLETIVAYVQQVAAALQHAHDQRLMHRDVKPENMLLGTKFEVLLSDFGLAMFTPHTMSMSTQAMDQPMMGGTIPYLAPEQVQGKPRPASDQYALGVVVYEWLCGSRPFSGSPIEIAMQHLSVPAPRLCEHVPDLPPAVEEVVLRALAKDPWQRFPSVQDFADALQHAYQVTLSPQATVVGVADLAGAAHIAAAGPAQERPSSVSTPGAAWSAEREEPPPLVRSVPIWRMPVSLTPFIGREQEVTNIGTLLSRPEVRLLTLVGTGGIGKTRLSLQVATQVRASFSDGGCFVSLAPISDPELVMPTIAQTLGLMEARGQSLREQLQANLREKQLLLLLDNFEQVATAAPPLTELLEECPQLKILVTSRAALHVHGEHEFPVPPLAVPDLSQLPEEEILAQYEAVALFIQQARANKPDFQITQTNARALAEICARLDGLPLAIELAAARIKLLPPQALLSRLERRLQLLTGGARNLPARQQTLRNTIQWSYALLDAQEQRLFQQLSVFVGGCTLEAAEALCATLDESDQGVPVLDKVDSLVDKSLLQQTEQEGEEPRLLMLETIREYGLEALTTSGEIEATQGAHAAYYLALVEQAEPGIRSPQSAAWLNRLEREHDNLRAALGWLLERGEARENLEMALRFSGALWRFWNMRGPVTEGRDFLERALARSEEVVAFARVKALQAAAELALTQDDIDQAQARCQEILVLCWEDGDAADCAHALSLLGYVARMRGDLDTARSLNEEAVALSRKAGDKPSIADSLHRLAFMHLERGEYVRAQALFEESLMLFKEIGNKEGIASALFQSAQTLFASQGDPASVHSLLKESLVLNKELGDKEGIATWSFLAGQVALSHGDAATAHTLLEESLQFYREQGDRHSTADALTILGRIARVRGNLAAARALHEASLASAVELWDQLSIAPGLEGLADVVAAQGELEWAARLWGAAEALREVIGAPIPPVERASYEHAVATARAQLGEKAFAATWTQGRTMTPEQALGAPERAAVSTQTSAGQPAITTTKPSHRYPAGLTAREVEVLRLVAQGMTDAQVAERLTISPRTVNTHLTSIYNKLGVDSRTAATRFAVQHLLI